MFTPGDPMELSSEMGRRQITDVDIDVDLDLTDEQAFERDDDYMAEEHNPGTEQDLFGRPLLQGRDDDMVDGLYSVQEAEEKKSTPDSVPDEQLEHVVISPTAVQEASELEFNADLTGDLSPNLELDISLNHRQAESAYGLPVTGEIDVLQHFAETTLSESQGPRFGESLESIYDLGDTKVSSEQHTPSETLDSTQRTIQEPGFTRDGPILRGEKGPSVSSPDVNDVAALLTTFRTSNETDSTYFRPILPVTLIYQDTEMSLFPPAEGGQTTYFLSDEGLVSQNIGNLFKACRVVLAGTIEDEETLELCIDDLGLWLSESTFERSTLNLADLIGLYVQLQSHDGIKYPRPLCLTLRTKYEFSTRLKYLKSHLAKGKGLSQLTTLTRVTEHNQSQDLHIDHGHLDQPYPGTSKAVSGTDLRYEYLNNNKEIDDGDLSSSTFEDGRPSSQHGKVTTAVVELREGELQMVTIENQSDYHSTARVPFGDSINAEVANVFTSEISNPHLDATVISNQKQSPPEHEDLIEYDNEAGYDEEYNYPGTSTDSSTIQGDALETVADCLGRPLNGTTLPEQEDEIERLTALESDSINVLDDQLILRSISDGTVGDHPRAISGTDYGRSGDPSTEHSENRENFHAVNHLNCSEMNFIVDNEGYKPDVKGTEASTCVWERQARRESNNESDPKYKHGVNTIILTNPEAQQQEELFGDNMGNDPLTSPVNSVNETENNQETFDTREPFLKQPAHTSARAEDMGHFSKALRNQDPREDLLTDSNAFKIPKNISQLQTPSTTEISQEKPADDDEITYEGDGNDPESSRTYTSTHISQVTPPLKRSRSDLEDSDPGTKDTKRNRST